MPTQNAGRQPILSIGEAYSHTIRFFVDENPYGDDPQVAGFYVIDASSRTVEENEGYAEILGGYATREEAERAVDQLYTIYGEPY